MTILGARCIRLWAQRVSLVALPAVAACRVENPTTPKTTTGPITFEGVLAGPGGEGGVITLTSATGAAGVSSAQLASSAAGSGGTANLTGTLVLFNRVSVTSFRTSLTGTLDETTGALTASGGGYSFKGTLVGSEARGTYTGPKGAGTFKSLSSSTSRSIFATYCGTYSGTGLVGLGILSLVRNGNAVVGTAYALSTEVLTSGGFLTGKVTGDTLSLTVSDVNGKQIGSGTGTISSSAAFGTLRYGLSPDTVTWVASTSWCLGALTATWMGLTTFTDPGTGQLVSAPLAFVIDSEKGIPGVIDSAFGRFLTPDPSTGLFSRGAVSGEISNSVFTFTLTQTSPCGGTATGSAQVTYFSDSLSGSLSGSDCQGPIPLVSLGLCRVPVCAGLSDAYVGAVTVQIPTGPESGPFTLFLGQSGTFVTGSFFAPDPSSGALSIGTVNGPISNSVFTFALAEPFPCAGTASGSAVANGYDSLSGSLLGRDCQGPIDVSSFGVHRSAASELLSAVASVSITPVGDTVIPGTSTLLVRGTGRFDAIVRDVHGNILPLGIIDWKSSNPSVVTVSSAHPAIVTSVTGVAPGSTTITATSEGHSGTTTITVDTGHVAVSLAPSVVVGGTAQATAHERGSTLGLGARWSSSSSSIASVNSSGLVTGVSAGTATITAGIWGTTATAVITVTP